MTAVFISVCYHIVRNCYSGPFIIVYLYDVYIAELLMLFANSILSLWHYSHLIEVRVIATFNSVNHRTGC